jgi:AcrR family transcriptional regulator
MARPQATDYDAKRKHICAHAATCFAQSGYPNASMVQIALASGVSKAGLYHYFVSKEAVLFDVLDGYVRELLQLSQAALASKADAAQALASLITALLATYATAQHQHRVLVTDTQHLSAGLREQVYDDQRQLVKIMAKALQAAYPKHIRPRHASAHAMMVFGMLNWTFTWLKTDGALSYAEYAKQVIATLDGGLAA